MTLPTRLCYKSYMPDSPASLALQQSDPVLALAPFSDRLQLFVQGSRRHLLWTGPLQAGSQQPIVYRWHGAKNVPVVRIIWQAIYGSLGTHRLRRLPECKEPVCVSPMCFTPATPMESAPLPDSLISERPLGGPKRYKTGTIGGLRDRHTWHGADMLILQCACGCGKYVEAPMCPAHHVLTQSWAHTGPGRVEMLGRQYRCSDCTRVLAFARRLRDSRPRAGYRPVTPETNNYTLERDDELARIFGEPDD